MNSQSSLTNRPDIDGLRALAVLPVLLYHARICCPGGFVGVDVFFVVSGYLITRLILHDLDSGTFQVTQFWERRIRRIMPALFVVVVACLAAGAFLFFPPDFVGLGQSAVAQALVVSNLYFWKHSGYFAEASEVKPLLHTWSLAVEEQFYLLFPLLLLVLKRWASHFCAQVILFLCALSFGLSVYLSYTHESANFFFLPPRAWELLIGSFLAATPVWQSPNKASRETLSCCGLVMILLAVFYYDRDTRFPGMSALLPCGGAALVIWTNGGARTWIGNLLAARPLVFIGLISYSLYLWHWPLLVFSSYWPGKLSLTCRMIILTASFGLAIFSWKYVETPFRKRVVLKRRSHLFAVAGGAAAVILAAGTTICTTQGLPSRMPQKGRHFAEASKNKLDNNVALKEALRGNFPDLGVSDKQKPLKLILWGDSQAMSLAPALDSLLKKHSARGKQATHFSTAPLIGFRSYRTELSLKEASISWNDAILDFIRREHVSDVVIACAWTGYAPRTNADAAATVRGCLLDTIASVRAAGARTWIVKQVPQHRWDVPSALARNAVLGGDPDEIGLPLADHLERSRAEDVVFVGVAGPNVTILDPTACFLTRSNLCRVAAGGEALYCDSMHLTVEGSMLLRPLFEPIFSPLSVAKTP
jgi:peptidoglycan/LPS O-acetylase OafA/YrhL